MKKNLLNLNLILGFMFFVCSFSYAQGTNRTGKVISDTGESIPGANVIIKDTKRGTLSAFDGSFTIKADDSEVLVVSYTGYEAVEIPVGNQNNIEVKLFSSMQQLDAVVVIGYGTQKKSDLTGAVSTVKASELTQTNAVNITNMLQGKAAGLNVNSFSSQPGAALAVTIRGSISPNGDNAPLYVVDGLPLTSNFSTEFSPSAGNFRGGFDRNPLNSINPNDIESIEVLKDASATAIYGSSAANGVILITTKKGKEGKTTVAYSSTYSVQTAKEYIRPLNATEFRQNVNNFGLEFFKIANGIAPYGTSTTPISGFTPYFTNQQIADAGEGTNYIDQVLRTGEITDTNFSISSGTEKTKIFTSINLFKQDGLLKNSSLKRISGRINLDQKIGKVTTFNVGVTYSQVNNDNVAVGQSPDTDSPSLLQAALQFAPDITPYNSDGSFSTSYYDRTPNPLSFGKITNQSITKRLLVTPKFDFNISEDLTFTAAGGIDNTTTERRFFVPVSANFITVPQGNAQLGYTKLDNYSAEGYLTYKKELGNHRLSAVIGGGFYRSEFSDFGLQAVGFLTDSFGLDNIGIAYNKDLSTVSSIRTGRNKLSQFNRFNYTYANRYIFQVTARLDATSNFPKENAYGIFPGVSAGWVVSNEEFLYNVSWINQLKFRAGYGTTGNESITATNNYAFSLYSLTSNYNYLIGNQLYNTGLYQTQIGNPSLKWETNITLNAGMDFNILKNNRIEGSVDYFSRTAKDLLDFRRFPSSNLIATQASNIGSTRSTGIEVTLRTKNIITKDFSWNSSFNIGTAKSVWVERNPAIQLAPYVKENDPIRAVYGWRTDGIIRSIDDIPSYQSGAFVGNLKYKDINGDGVLDINDVEYLGNTDPKASFGFSNSFTYKDFSLSISIYGTYGGLTFDSSNTFVNPFLLARPGTPSNVEANSLNVFSSFNPDGIYQGLAIDNASGNNPTGINDFRTQSNSYFARIKDLNFGYNIPVTNFGFIDAARIYVNFENLYVFTNILGLDPEMERNNNPYPTALTSSLGFRLQF